MAMMSSLSGHSWKLHLQRKAIEVCLAAKWLYFIWQLTCRAVSGRQKKKKKTLHSESVFICWRMSWPWAIVTATKWREIIWRLGLCGQKTLEKIKSYIFFYFQLDVGDKVWRRPKLENFSSRKLWPLQRSFFIKSFAHLDFKSTEKTLIRLIMFNRRLLVPCGGGHVG